MIAYYRSQLLPASVEQLAQIITRFQLSCVLPYEEQDQSDIVIEDFIRDIADTPPDILQSACDTWRRQSKYWPHSSEFLALTIPLIENRRGYLDSLLKLKERQERRKPPDEEMKSKNRANLKLVKNAISETA